MNTLLTEAEAASRLRMSPRSLRDLRQQGRIRYVAITARKIVYREDDLDEYVEASIRVEQPAVEVKPQGKRRRQSISATPSGKVVPFTQRKKV